MLEIITGKRPNRVTGPTMVGDADQDSREYDISSESSNSSVLSLVSVENVAGETSEAQELLSAIKIGLHSLLKTSIFVRKFTVMDKRPRAARTDPFDDRADIMYVNDKYPLLAKKNQALATRLGRANARRRQYFKYCRDHNDRLSEVPIEDDDMTAKLMHQSQSKILSKEVDHTRSGLTRPSQALKSEATAFAANRDEQAPMIEPPPALSIKSFASSITPTSEGELPFPALPDEAQDGSPFLCQYCHTYQELAIEKQWRLG